MNFIDLQNLKTPAVVMVALGFNEAEKAELIEEMNEAFTEDGLLQDGSRIIDIEKIEGNILGDEGRTDVLIHLDKFAVNPLVRIAKWRDVKWLEDYVVNYAGDYGFGDDSEYCE